jgi:hypothetical protein
MSAIKCNKCGKKIDFIKTEAGQIIPIESDFQGFFLSGDAYTKVYKLHECRKYEKKGMNRTNVLKIKEGGKYDNNKNVYYEGPDSGPGVVRDH